MKKKVEPIKISIMSDKKEGGKYPKKFTKDGNVYHLVKEYNNYARYERRIRYFGNTIKIQEGFNRFDLGLVEYRKVDENLSTVYKYVSW